MATKFGESTMHRLALGSMTLLVIALSLSLAQPTLGPTKDYSTAIAALDAYIAREVKNKGFPSLAIALVDDQSIVWSKGFGHADPKGAFPATADTVYRVGSVSKLFTDIGIMQLVEKGVLDLDAPVTKYVSDFQPRNPFNKPITVRMLMAHRSGLVREPPVGHYFDPTVPTLAASVKSLNATELVYEPGTHTKYSNAAIATVGYVLESTQQEPFVKYLKRAVLEPMGLRKSGFEETPDLAKDAAFGLMWTYHGRAFPAPTFNLGIAPAGSLYTTVNDLGRFISVLFAGGKPVLKKESLEEMWKPQLAKDGENVRFGLGFILGDLDGHRRVGHNGAIYGFATELAILPDDKLGVVVVAAKDCANAATEHIANVALRQMLAVRQGKPLPKIENTTPAPANVVRALAGRYMSGDRGMDLSASAGRLYVLPTRGGFRTELRMRGDDLITDDPLDCGHTLQRQGEDKLVGSNGIYVRTSVEKPKPLPGHWRGLIGEYGWDHDILYILERDGKLHALIEWFFLYPLQEVSADVYKFPNWGLYQDEKLIFTRDVTDRATEVEAASVVFKRRHIDGENGATFKIRPLRPTEELRKEALAAQPPKEVVSFRDPDLVELVTLDPTIKLDIRYATANNFLGAPLYSSAKAFLQRPAAEALVRAHRKLAAQGYGLLIHDGYRPWYVTKMFWDATPEQHHIFVADPLQGSRHNRGCAVDLTLYDLPTGKPIEMVGGYDEFSDRSYPDYPGGASLERWHRDLLRRTMEDEGFTVYEAEWWHFDYLDWKKYPILNLTFEQLKASKSTK
jgi:CubicO group peptidase (beta-lactamase class C family)/D-alanyl-D-alanine dipeptidase